MRKLAILINSSGQRRHRFERVQRNMIDDPNSSLDRILVLIIDVSTRWDSTYLILIRILRLREAIY